MNTTIRKNWLVLTGLVALAAPVLAQGEDERRGQRQGRNPLLAALDRNGNGKLDAEEIDLAVASLRKLDRNKDGEITREEIGGAPRRPGQSPGAPGSDRPQRPRLPNFAELDKDDDGKISKEEAPERMRNAFERLDTNGDGFFDKEEQEALLKRMRDRFQGGQRRPGGRPDRGDGQGGTDKPKRPAPKDE